MIINWIEYLQWEKLKELARKSWWVTNQTIKNRLKNKLENKEILIIKWNIYIRKDIALI